MAGSHRTLRELRIARGLTQRELGRALRVNVQNVINWEAGLCQPNRCHEEKLIRYFGFLPCFGPSFPAVAPMVVPQAVAPVVGNDYRHYEQLRAAASLLVDECADLGLLTAEQTIAKLLAEFERSAAHALADATRLVA